LARAGHRCSSIGGPASSGLGALAHLRYRLPAAMGRAPHPWAVDLSTKCHRAEAVADCVVQLVGEGFKPDLVIGHPGWGELLAIKDVLPAVPVLHHLEFVYQLQGADVGFDPEFHLHDWYNAAQLRLRRAPQLLAFHDLDHAWAPTHWQASTAPEQFRSRVSVIHEGIDTARIRPLASAHVELQRAGLCFRLGDEVVSFVARNLEPCRGFQVFMRMLPRLQALRPGCHVVIVGGDGVGYGALPAGGGSWRQALLKELCGQLDLSRVHFVGRVPHSVLLNLFQVSACHVYLTYPFVLSWSLLEAMSCGAVVVGSATPPVQEVIEHGVNGLLVDFFDAVGLANAVADVLTAPSGYTHLGQAARESVQQRYDLASVCLPQQLRLVEGLAAG
jgi:glycosyltransferase involved in cell wall biosynthesis